MLVCAHLAEISATATRRLFNERVLVVGHALECVTDSLEELQVSPRREFFSFSLSALALLSHSVRLTLRGYHARCTFGKVRYLPFVARSFAGWSGDGHLYTCRCTSYKTASERASERHAMRNGCEANRVITADDRL